jgi:hypothetical protein
LREINILVIAGYGQDADKSPPHRDFIINSARFGIQMGIKIIYAVGGATNPDFPDRTEADATDRVLLEVFRRAFLTPSLLAPRVPVVVLREGDTSADTLKAVKREILEHEHKIDTLILACETSRSAGFLMDSLFVGLSQLAKRIIVYTEPFPETPEEFERQKKKLLLKLLSHRSRFFNWLRRLYQKRHQRKVAKTKRKLASSPRP